MISNIVEFFKDHDPRMEKRAGQGRIFFHRDCLGNSRSYTIDKVNSLFKENENPDHLLERMVSIMSRLQEAFHLGDYSVIGAGYEHAKEEYPKHYLALVKGLDDEALDAIRQIKMSDWNNRHPDDLGQQFCEQIMKDRKELMVGKTLKGPPPMSSPILSY